mgnify:CR=1 FL=1
MKIGVLDIQGSVEEHFASLQKLKGVEAVLVKKIADLKDVRGLIIPGGESTTIGKLLRRFGLAEEIGKRFADGKLAIWGTCAGAILIAREIVGREQADSLKLMDITVERNAYGRQLDSFETELDFDFGSDGVQKIPAVFIRAPRISKVAKKAEILAKYDGEIVSVRDGKLLATTFHPEMTDDLRVHQYFANMC